MKREVCFSTAAARGRAKPGETNVDRTLNDRWPWWLETRWGTVAAMNRAYGSSHKSFRDVPGSVAFAEAPFDPCAYDFRCYLNDRGYDRCKRQCDVIRSVSPGHMIVLGNNAWLSPDQDLWLANGFHNRAVEDLFDFVTFHPSRPGSACPTAAAIRWTGASPCATGSTAASATPGWTGTGSPWWSRSSAGTAAARRGSSATFPVAASGSTPEYTRTLCEALIPHVNGFINWPTMDMPKSRDVSNHGGIFTHDGKRKELAGVYAELVERLQGRRHVRARGTTTLRCSLLGLYTSRPYQDQMRDKVHATLEAGRVPDFRFI